MKSCFNVQSHQCAISINDYLSFAKLSVGFAEELKGGWIDSWSV